MNTGPPLPGLFIGISLLKEDIVTHLVMCWLDEALKNDEIDMVIRETKQLEFIPGVQEFYIGRAIQSDRDIVDDSFTFAISMKFRNVAEMETYLQHEVHVRYVQDILKPRASRITVHDF